MGNFWDQFVFRVCVGLGEEHFPEGFRSAASLIEQAHGLDRLPMDRLNDLSLLLIVLVCESDLAAHQQAFAEARRRGLEPRQAWVVLREALPPRLSDLLLIGHHREARQRSLVLGILHQLYLPTLVRFRTRLTLCSTAAAYDLMALVIHKAFDSLEDCQILHEEFLCHLYQHVQVLNWGAADDWPSTPLLWRNNLDPAEEVFLNRCLRMDAEHRCLLYLSFYARLNAGQIRCIFQDNKHLRVQDVVEVLCEMWAGLLPDLE